MIVSACRVGPRDLPPGVHPASKTGLAYERKVFKALESAPGRSPGVLVEHNPWFHYRTVNGRNHFCCADILIRDPECEFALVLEVKLTWVPDAEEKLKEVYCPVVSRTLGVPAKGLVICKNLIHGAPRPQSSLTFAMLSKHPVLQWLGNAPIPW